MDDPLVAIWSPRIKLIHTDLADCIDQISSMIDTYTSSILRRIPDIHTLTRMIMDHPDKEYYTCHEACIPGYYKMNGANWISYTMDGYLQPLNQITPLSQYHTDMKYILSGLNSDEEWRRLTLGGPLHRSPGPDAYVGVNSVNLTLIWNLSRSMQCMEAAIQALYFGKFSYVDAVNVKSVMASHERLFGLEYRILM